MMRKMMTRCKGCGVTLQYTDKNALGYTPKQGSEYCQRCFRLIHYDDLTVSMRTGIPKDEILEQLENTEGMLVWVSDLFDFEASMVKGLGKRFADREIILVCTKRDLIPSTINNEKIAQFIFSRIKEMGIHVNQLVFTQQNDKESFENLKEEIRQRAHNKPVIFLGKANVGKSTVLNNLLEDNILTSSRYPGTTLEFNQVVKDGITYIDTPGIELENTILQVVDEKDLKAIIPNHEIKPEIYQIYEPQSFALAGLARLDIQAKGNATVVFYRSESINIHRSKIENADNLWANHYGKMLSPISTTNEVSKYTVKKDLDKMDVVIDGLGWACISGDVSTITVTVPKGVNVTYRKAMI